MIGTDNLKKLEDNVKADKATWNKIVDEVLEDERRKRREAKIDD